MVEGSYGNRLWQREIMVFREFMVKERGSLITDCPDLTGAHLYKFGAKS